MHRGCFMAVLDVCLGSKGWFGPLSVEIYKIVTSGNNYFCTDINALVEVHHIFIAHSNAA